MSYPPNLTPEQQRIWSEEMRRPVAAGTVVFDSSGTFELLEDSCQHGCPRVRFLTGSRKGEETFRTLYLHGVPARMRCEYLGKPNG